MSKYKKDKLNIFIDTNTINGDWFFESKNLRILLYLVNTQEVAVYVSSVVMEEFRKHFKNKVKDIEDNIIKSNESLNKLRKYNRPVEIDLRVNEIIEKFDEKCVEVLVNHFFLVKYPKGKNYKEMMDSIILNAIYEKPPFKKKDDGFRDAVIFESYLYFIKENELMSNFFVTRDAVFMENSISKRINEIDVNFQVVDSFDKLFSIEPISKLLEKKKEVIDAESFIRKTIINYLDENKELIIDKLSESFMEGLYQDSIDNYEFIQTKSYMITDISFDYQFDDELWISVYQEITVELKEITSVYDTDEKAYINIPIQDVNQRVGCTTGLMIDTSEIKDFKAIRYEDITISSCDAEQVLDEYNHKEIYFEEMPI